MGDGNAENFLTTQKALATAVGYTPGHFSGVIANKIPLTIKFAESLQQIASYPILDFIRDDVPERRNKIKAFISKQKLDQIRSRSI